MIFFSPRFFHSRLLCPAAVTHRLEISPPPPARLPFLNLPDEQHREMLDYAKRSSQKPYFNAFELVGGFIIEVYLPGLSDKKAVDIEFIDNQTLLIKGKTKKFAPVDGEPGFVEMSFEQTFKLLHSINQDSVSAHLDAGTLMIVLPKAEKRKVQVQ